jgi:glycosyltransferase involved in cell wall biosynthesis
MKATSEDNPLIVYMTTHAQSARLLLAGQMDYMRSQGFEVALICSPDSVLDELAQRERIAIYPVKIDREMSPFRDLVALFRIYRLLARLKPQLVNAGTPKAGLLGMIAALLTFVPIRIYTLRGLRLETTSGWKRQLLRVTEKIAAACSHQVICNSESLRKLYIKLGLAKHSNTTVLGAGSGNGVDSDRFQFTKSQLQQAQGLRAELEIASDCRVVGFVGRLTRDKGIVELVDAFKRITVKNSSVHLLLVGGFESGDAIPQSIINMIEENPRISVTGFVPDTALYYSLFDLVVLPSHREGFPNVALEAAAASQPVVGYRATGTVDAVQDGITGRLVPIGCVESLATAIQEFIADPKLSRRCGEAGRRRVQKNFLREIVWQAWAECYWQHLKKHDYEPAMDVAGHRLQRVARQIWSQNHL